MKNTTKIRPIRVEEAGEAKRLIYNVACPLIEPLMPVEDAIAQYEEWGVLNDMEDIQKNYFDNGGVFLVTEVDGRIVGTGAFKYYADGLCELKRLYFLPEYQGRGHGYAMVQELIRRAQVMRYKKVCLWTTYEKQPRAVAFYHRLGFVDIVHEGAEDYELWMELDITLKSNCAQSDA
jgi:putative acetyltransferase